MRAWSTVRHYIDPVGVEPFVAPFQNTLGLIHPLLYNPFMGVGLCSILVLFGFLCGIGHARILKRHEDMTLDTVHRFTRLPLLAGGMVGAVVLTMVLLGLNRELYWSLPMWVDSFSAPIRWSGTFLLLGYVFTLTSVLAWSEDHQNRIHFTMIAMVIVGSLLLLRHLRNPPLSMSEKGKFTYEGHILQTTGSTCAAASGANIAKFFDVPSSEVEMVEVMGTTGEGTSVSQAIVGMRKVGMEGTKVLKEDLQDLNVPAMLFVDHYATGPESHAVALVVDEHGTPVIVDPLMGEIPLNRFEASEVWHGKAVEFTKSSL